MRRREEMAAVPAFAPAVLAEAIRRQPLTPAKVGLAWQVVAGPQLARAAEAELHGTSTILLRAKDPRWASELDRSRALLVERLKLMLSMPELTVEVV
jgi:hypothetical protein